jgi:hypothetical protein
MSDDDDVIRLGRDRDRVPVPLRGVFPWWFLGVAVLLSIVLRARLARLRRT